MLILDKEKVLIWLQNCNFIANSSLQYDHSRLHVYCFLRIFLSVGLFQTVRLFETVHLFQNVHLFQSLEYKI